MVQSCSHLNLKLDLRGLSLNGVSTIFRDCTTLRLELLLMDKNTDGLGLLKMSYNNIKNLIIDSVNFGGPVQVV